MNTCIARIDYEPPAGEFVSLAIDWDHVGPADEGFEADQTLGCAGVPLVDDAPIVPELPPVAGADPLGCSASSPPYTTSGVRTIAIRFTATDGSESYGQRPVVVRPSPSKPPPEVPRPGLRPPVAGGPIHTGPFLPAKGKIFNGVTGGTEFDAFLARAGKRPAVWQHFVRWGGGFGYALREAASEDARSMLHISTAGGQRMSESISPGAIARGKGDGYLVRLTKGLARYPTPAYIRLMGEMNNCNNAYAAYSCSGARRNAAHSTTAFKQAWKRSYLILHGGEVAAINRRLRKLHLPAVRTGAKVLPRPQVAFVWAPMTRGSPMTAAMEPSAYWPGGGWVDWVGTSFYSRFPNFGWLDSFYNRFAVGQHKPFAIAEWGMWGADDAAFPRRLFAWVKHHSRVRMVQYNQGDLSNGPFRLRHYPRAAEAIRQALASGRFLESGTTGP